MSWIQKHWDREYLEDAEAKIKRTVRPFHSILVSLTSDPLQDDRISWTSNLCAT